MKEPATVLVVNCEADLPHLLSASPSGDPLMDIVSVGSGGQALETLHTNQAFDLVVTDMGLPDMTGADLCRSIQADGLLLRPAVLLVADQSREGNAVEAGRSAGATGVLLRPLEQMTLKSWCYTALRMHQLERDLAEREDELARLKATMEPCSHFVHEVNNPLQSSYSAADLLAIYYSDDERIQGFAAQIQDSCDRISKLVTAHCRALKAALGTGSGQDNS